MRNIDKYAEAGRNIIDGRRDLTYKEIRALFDYIEAAGDKRSALYNVIANSFYMGVNAGASITRKALKDNK